MRDLVQSFRAQAEAQARELLQAIEGAEAVIVSSIERECDALRGGQMLAAQALRLRLHDAAKLYINLIRAARASLWTLEQVLPGLTNYLDTRRATFAALLRVELAVLAAERAAAEPATGASREGNARGEHADADGAPPPETPARRLATSARRRRRSVGRAEAGSRFRSRSGSRTAVPDHPRSSAGVAERRP